ncbi:probable disease resistance protein RF9 [Macadamia integrifolia]|uniref:probable disease resistance protein RF9 n=1 Tax=Macadamia integrifolia TaxID=60698 RepID=UPI001C5017C6|nr:probable disease resistance protein RF9 [Macadamia integrifolia]
MSSTLRDATDKCRTRNEVEEWVNQVRDVVMEAEDVIDFFIIRAERQLHRNFLTRYICYPNQLYYLHKLGREIANSIKKINQLSVRRSTLGLATSEAELSSVGMITNEQELPFFLGDLVEEFSIGFEKEESEIAKKLLIPIGSPGPFPGVVSVVGMSGSGKTTLARRIHRRNDVKQHFRTRAWISVSQQYRIKDLLQVIIEQIKPLTAEEKKELDVESLIHRLSSYLKETTYLMVFKQIGKLILPKYSSVRGTDILELPSSIGDLENLQTLDLRFTCLRQLPMTMMKIQQLRNLVLRGPLGCGPQNFDCPLDHMTNLQTLMLHEGKWMSRLDKLTNLRALYIFSEKNQYYPFKEALLNAIPKLNHLRGLSLVDSKREEEAVVLPASFSDNLELYHMELEGIIGIRDFPPNVTTLILNFQSGQRMDELMEKLKKLANLRCLILIKTYLGSKIIFSADGFRQLEELVLTQLDDLQDLIVEEGALPNLKVLRILRCFALKRLPLGLKQLVTLRELTLSVMSKELEHRVQKETGVDWEIIKHIPCIETKSELTHFHLRKFYRQWC